MSILSSLPDLTLPTLRQAYLGKRLNPSQVIEEIRKRIERTRKHCIWIHVLSEKEISRYLEPLQKADPRTLPLYGVPFAIKDNIDLADVSTTAGCPDFAYLPSRSATVVDRLIEAGAIPVGKTNLDQFATGLVGSRSPYGVCRNSFDPAYIAGGSSAGSAVAVALGQASFALGTDTAGSGRVPAAFNNLVGYKPTRGIISTSGVVPACRTLDCVSLFTLSANDAECLAALLIGEDPRDAYSRSAVPKNGGCRESFTFGVPQSGQLEFFGNADAAALFWNAVERLEQMGGTQRELDFSPFFETARQLYEGPWVAERYAAIEGFIEQNPEALHPTTRAIIEPARKIKAVDAFKAFYRLQTDKHRADAVLSEVDFAVTPTTGTLYTVARVLEDPFGPNADLGFYTNFMNLLDYAALALPSGFDSNGLPAGITFFSFAFDDRALLSYGKRYLELIPFPLGAAARSTANPKKY
ncbi:MAG: allophanate hydrolase [Methylothermaceae bacterium]|nr:allophanate hydrolase [Methylothermaceae bacterium]